MLAVYWYCSWGLTLVVVLWAVLLFFVLRERDRGIRRQTEKTLAREPSPYDSVRWLTVRLCWLLWFAALFVLLLLAWGADWQLIRSLFQTLNTRYSIGAMHFSAMGVVYAFIALTVTHAITRYWSHSLVDRLFSETRLEAGLKNSISKISVYGLWVLGVLVALNLLGVSTATMAVVFGALGIGLGFGLQNIFNNFISGLILLFERPIQRGDAVEINGVWGEVRRINIRSTVVQTYDNASLIIPNSQFISSQVTNWSFKDRRIRRRIDIGVAYGTNTALVRDTLLEIADKTEGVLKYPNPVVLFMGFGASSLDFQLRVWCDVDICLTVDTTIRFAIDQAFREQDITIPFPQRDIHIQTDNTRENRESTDTAAGIGNMPASPADKESTPDGDNPDTTGPPPAS
jgi:small-conductance mechanosensitive channel